MTRRPFPYVLLVMATMTSSILVSAQSARAATAASISAPSALTASDTISFPSNVWHVNASNVVLRIQGTTTNLGATLTCFNAAYAVIGCNMGPVRTGVLEPSSALTPCQRDRVVVNPS